MTERASHQVAPSQGAVVISLNGFKAAVRAALALRDLLYDPPWLREVTVNILADGNAEVLVVLNYQTTLIRRCLPTSVNDTPVHLAVKEAE